MQGEPPNTCLLTAPFPPALSGERAKQHEGMAAADLSEQGGPPLEGGSTMLQAAGTPNAVIQELG